MPVNRSNSGNCKNASLKLVKPVQDGDVLGNTSNRFINGSKVTTRSKSEARRAEFRGTHVGRSWDLLTNLQDQDLKSQS